MKNNRGFMLAETLIVTTFVAGVLIFLFIQFSKLSSSYNEYYNYNTVEGLYGLEDIKDYIKSDALIYNKISTEITDLNYIDITSCEHVTNIDYCKKIFELENIDRIIVTSNNFNLESISIANEGLLNFMKKISREGEENYRLIAHFTNNSYATLRF